MSDDEGVFVVPILRVRLERNALGEEQRPGLEFFDERRVF
jgi:hypothetical protein